MVCTALLDTSVVIHLERFGDQQVAAALGKGHQRVPAWDQHGDTGRVGRCPHATDDPAERAVRQARLQWAEAVFEPLAFDEAAARAYGVVYALVRAEGRKARGRLADLLIASIALVNGLPLLTRNPKDFTGVDNRFQVVVI